MTSQRAPPMQQQGVNHPHRVGVLTLMLQCPATSFLSTTNCSHLMALHGLTPREAPGRSHQFGVQGMSSHFTHISMLTTTGSIAGSPNWHRLEKKLKMHSKTSPRGKVTMWTQTRPTTKKMESLHIVVISAASPRRITKRGLHSLHIVATTHSVHLSWFFPMTCLQVRQFCDGSGMEL